jgi:hypothetical protein
MAASSLLAEIGGFYLGQKAADYLIPEPIRLSLPQDKRALFVADAAAHVAA